MAAIKDRGDGNMKRKERVARLKKGPGLFVYNGTAKDHDWSPTPQTVGKAVQMLDDAGMPVVDGSGRPVYERESKYVRDAKGNVVMGGPPKIKTRLLDVFNLWGVEFPEGERVEVTNAALALKLRGMDGFDEVDEATDEAADETPSPSPPKRKPGRPRKVTVDEPTTA